MNGCGGASDRDERSAAQLSGLLEWQLRPVQNNEGTWDALDGNGYGHVLEFRTAEWVETWIDGYNTGARENA